MTEVNKIRKFYLTFKAKDKLKFKVKKISKKKFQKKFQKIFKKIILKIDLKIYRYEANHYMENKRQHNET